MLAVIMCEALADILNGTISYEPNSTAGSHEFGTVASFNCTEGFALVGPEDISCSGNGSSTMGQFTPEPPSCECKVFGSNIGYIEVFYFVQW